MENQKKIVVGVSGGIAAYKACHVVREFTEHGDDVTVVPTEAALQFVGKSTFEALSGNPVSTTVFEAVDEVRHVNVGKQADLIVVAPATADFIARVAGGRADDLLTATILVATCPVVLAPAMHTEMWLNPATQANVHTLRSRGITVLEPAHGRLTGTDSGPGRMLEPHQIVTLARTVLAGETLQPTLAGKTVLITAGGTREAIDPVRFIGNYSSGRQGFALADIAVHRGAHVILIAGHTESVTAPSGATVIRVASAQEMQTEVEQLAAGVDIIIMAAAVADFRPKQVAESKLKKGSSAQTGLSAIQLVENTDILKGLVDKRKAGELPAQPLIMGFAAETGDTASSALEYAQAKLAKKGCDFLMFNDVAGGKVFGQSHNRGFLFSSQGTVTDIADGTKHVVAAQIMDVIEEHLGGN
ncbi:MAG: bifunctional phosphopantothenoylcysteine decarboxylase/phosphopantothenate--cysteine ligase CoaBC [Corynebacterium sp.]|nr:bifunctional phosphopantothenoylcysteine decarboxylase/phosphopantothenate--cysteine ligase CoaBC [Corynebacterium sp.]